MNYFLAADSATDSATDTFLAADSNIFKYIIKDGG